MSILSRIKGAVLALTAPMWLPFAVLFSGVANTRYCYRYVLQDIRLHLRLCWGEVKYAAKRTWSNLKFAFTDRLDDLGASYQAGVKEPARGLWVFLVTQVLTRLVGIVLLIASPLILVWGIMTYLIEEGVFGDFYEFLGQLVDIVRTGRFP